MSASGTTRATGPAGCWSGTSPAPAAPAPGTPAGCWSGTSAAPDATETTTATGPAAFRSWTSLARGASPPAATTGRAPAGLGPPPAKPLRPTPATPAQSPNPPPLWRDRQPWRRRRGQEPAQMGRAGGMGRRRNGRWGGESNREQDGREGEGGVPWASRSLGCVLCDGME